MNDKKIIKKIREIIVTTYDKNIDREKAYDVIVAVVAGLIDC